MNTVTKLAINAYVEADKIFKVMSVPHVIHILSVIEKKREVTISEITTSKLSRSNALKYIRMMKQFNLVKQNRLGMEVTYKLNYDKLDTINSAAARILPG